MAVGGNESAEPEERALICAVTEGIKVAYFYFYKRFQENICKKQVQFFTHQLV